MHSLSTLGDYNRTDLRRASVSFISNTYLNHKLSFE